MQNKPENPAAFDLRKVSKWVSFVIIVAGIFNKPGLILALLWIEWREQVAAREATHD